MANLGRMGSHVRFGSSLLGGSERAHSSASLPTYVQVTRRLNMHQVRELPIFAMPVRNTLSPKQLSEWPYEVPAAAVFPPDAGRVWAAKARPQWHCKHYLECVFLRGT